MVDGNGTTGSAVNGQVTDPANDIAARTLEILTSPEQNQYEKVARINGLKQLRPGNAPVVDGALHEIQEQMPRLNEVTTQLAQKLRALREGGIVNDEDLTAAAEKEENRLGFVPGSLYGKAIVNQALSVARSPDDPSHRQLIDGDLLNRALSAPTAAYEVRARTFGILVNPELDEYEKAAEITKLKYQRPENVELVNHELELTQLEMPKLNNVTTQVTEKLRTLRAGGVVSSEELMAAAEKEEDRLGFIPGSLYGKAIVKQALSDANSTGNPSHHSLVDEPTVKAVTAITQLREHVGNLHDVAEVPTTATLVPGNSKSTDNGRGQ